MHSGKMHIRHLFRYGQLHQNTMLPGVQVWIADIRIEW